MVVKSGRQCSCEVTGEWKGEVVARSVLGCQPVIGPATRSHQACDASHQTQSRRDSIRHGESNPVAADLVLRGNGDSDIGLAELTCQIVTKLLEGIVAGGFIHCPLDVERGEASGCSEFLLGD